MELSSAKKCAIERDRVVGIVRERQGKPSHSKTCPKFLSKSSRAISKRGKENLQMKLLSNMGPVLMSLSWTTLFFFIAFFAGLNVRYEFVTCTVLNYTSVLAILCFSDGEQRQKGVDYRIWRNEVESSLAAGLHSESVIVEQIHRSL